MKSGFLVGTVSMLAAQGLSQAAVVLSIDVTDPSAVVITSVANNSAITQDLSVNFNGGISFRNFFTSSEDVTTAVSIVGDWTSAGTTSSFNEFVTFVYNNPAVVAGVDLSIYNSVVANSDEQNFTTSAAPFTGSSTIDFTGRSLPLVGAMGDVHAGYEDSHGGVIGQWIVTAVPEPSTAFLGVFGLFGILRRRR